MANKIRGVAVEVAGDVTALTKAVNDAKKSAKSATQDFTTLQKSLQLNYNEEKFAVAQAVAQKAIDETAKAADALREKMQLLEENGGIDTAEYDKAQRELNKVELQAEQLKQQLEQLNQIKFDKLSKQVTDVGNKIQGVGKVLTPLSAMSAATITALGAVGKKAISTADDIATLATKYDMSSTALQRFNYVALQTDVQAEDLYKAFTKVRAAAADMATGTSSTASNALRQLNLDFEAFDGSEEQFYAIANALANMSDKTQMVAIANDIFGDKLATNLLPLIYAGTDAINNYRNEFDESGALTDEQVSKLAEFDNVLNKIMTQLSNVTAQIGASLLPIMEALSNVVSTTIVPKLQQLAEWFNNLSLGQQKFALAALAVVAVLAPLTLGIGKLVTAVGSIIKILPKLGAAMSTLAANPIILIIAAVVAVLALLYTKCEAFRESINNLASTLGAVLQPILDVVMQLLNGVINAISPIIEIVGQLLAVIINMANGVLQSVVDIIMDIFNAISPLLDIVMSMLDMVLMPLKMGLSMLLAILKPILSVALIPLQLALKSLQIPLQMLGSLLSWISQLFAKFATIVKSAFAVVLEVINDVLGKVEDAINWCIAKINTLIDKVNKALSKVGVNLKHIDDVSLQINASLNTDDKDLSLDATLPNSGDQTYDKIGVGGYSGDTISNDYSTTNTTQNITVVIENYASEVDVDDLVNQLNRKFAEMM